MGNRCRAPPVGCLHGKTGETSAQTIDPARLFAYPACP